MFKPDKVVLYIITLLVIGVYLHSVAADLIIATIRSMAQITIVASAIAAFAIISSGVFWLFLHLREKNETCLTQKANRKLAERDSSVLIIVAKGDDAVYVRDSDPKRNWMPIHLNPARRQNGIQSEPTTLELSAWQTFHSRSASAADGPALLEAPEQVQLPDRVDLLDLLPRGNGNLGNIVLGVSVNNGSVQPLAAPIWQLVHIANAGATDSGKSNLSRAIAYQCVTAKNAQTVFADLKRQTYKCFKNASNLLYPIVTNVQDFISVIAELKAETEKRLSLFEPYPTVETIHDYNKIETPLPYVIAFIDEISNIFMDKDAQRVFLELIRVSRAAGIYIVASGQTWGHRTLSTSIRQQFRTGFHFGTNDAHSSRMILNDPSAVEIEQQGRAKVLLPFGLANEILEVQTPFLALETAAYNLTRGGPATVEMPIAPKLDQSPIKDLPKPTEKQERILKLWDASTLEGDLASVMGKIAQDVYADPGGRQRELVERTLRKFDRI